MARAVHCFAAAAALLLVCGAEGAAAASNGGARQLSGEATYASCPSAPACGLFRACTIGFDSDFAAIGASAGRER